LQENPQIKIATLTNQPPFSMMDADRNHTLVMIFWLGQRKLKFKESLTAGSLEKPKGVDFRPLLSGRRRKLGKI